MFGMSESAAYESKEFKIFRAVIVGIIVIGFLLWSFGRHHYTGTIVAVKRIETGRYHRTSHQNEVTIRIKSKNVVFSDSSNSLVGKDAPLDPKPNKHIKYRITTIGFPGKSSPIREDILKLTKIKSSKNN